MTVRRVLLVSLAALLLAGCGASGEPVPLLTATEPDPLGSGACYLWWGQGELIEDATHGTAISEPSGNIITLKWPMGYTARRSGGTIEVLDTTGNVAAMTGRKYQFFTSAWTGNSGPAYTGGPGCAREIDSFIE
jgi:hypothetical protein